MAAVAKINRAIDMLDWPLVLKTPLSHIVLVCNATEMEWDAYVESELQTLKSPRMEWIDGEVYIVELSTMAHAVASHAVSLHTNHIPGIGDYLDFCGAAYTSTGTKYELDDSFGPSVLDMKHLGAVLPRGVADWPDFITVKIEVGYIRRWGDCDGQLDWKANLWATIPGVAYVLCIALAVDELARRPAFSYKLYKVETTGDRLGRQDPVAIEAPSTFVMFDSRLLLGLPATADLPPGFPDPNVAVDLYAALREVFRITKAKLR